MKNKTINKALIFTLASVSTLGVVSSIGTINAHAESLNINELTAGDIIIFGGQRYVLIDPSSGYIVKETPIDKRDFSSGAQDYLFSPGSPGNIGNYLNTEFINGLSMEEKSKIVTHKWGIVNVNAGNTLTTFFARVGLVSNTDAQNNPFVANILKNSWSIDTSSEVNKPIALNGTAWESKDVSHVANVHPALYLKPDSIVPFINENKVTNTSTKVVGTFESTILDVSIPATVSFLFNPNTQTLNAQDLIINNQSNAPVYAWINKIKVSDDSSWKPSLVEPNKYSTEQWNNLTKYQTKAEIALGIVRKDSTNWLKEISNETIWSSDIKEYGRPPVPYVRIGNIKTKSSVVMQPTLQSGTSLDSKEVMTANYVFEFGLN